MDQLPVDLQVIREVASGSEGLNLLVLVPVWYPVRERPS